MRALYFICWFCLGFSFRLFFKRVVQVRPSKKRFGRTIFVSNHPSAFLDPIVIARLRKPVVYFMTRSDVFNKFTKPLFWLAHMLPIYRQQDGGDSQEKNKKVFKKATQALARNRNLLVFGEGITDDIFERRLKPVKKGAIRIGFTALEDLNWSVEIQVQGLGINYTNPGVLRSEVLIAGAEPIVLNNYKEAYLENPSKVISDLNRELEARMQDQITHVISDENVILHEQIQQLTRKGMHVYCFDPKLSLEERWQYSQNLAKELNNNPIEGKSQFQLLKQQIQDYFLSLSEQKLTEAELYWFGLQKNWKLNQFLKLILWLPFFVLGLLHVALPYVWVKRFVEKKLKRPVFWSGAKMGMLLVILPLWNIILLTIAGQFIHLCWLYWLFYFLSLNLVAHGFHRFITTWKIWRKSGRFSAQKFNNIVNQREELLKHLKEIGF
ncbi:MAG: 1-acyl-sn-glycerol-3-phosphate acyltransferase [Flavobacteriales bacterium]